MSVPFGRYCRIHVDTRDMSNEEATALWISGGNHPYEHVVRPTGNFGNEHYFHKDIYWLFSSSRR